MDRGSTFDKVIGILEARRVTNIKLVINRLRPNMVKAENMLSIGDIQDILGIQLLGVIPDSERVIIAANRGEPLVLNKKLYQIKNVCLGFAPYFTITVNVVIIN
mgnify:CR=1 FL=1